MSLPSLSAMEEFALWWSIPGYLAMLAVSYFAKRVFKLSPPDEKGVPQADVLVFVGLLSQLGLHVLFVG